MDVENKIAEIAREIEEHIIGRVANKIGDTRYNNLETLMKYVYRAGGGNHLEIGTLFGGSAIAAAMVKEEFNQSGMVFCIDPLDGYYEPGRADPSGIYVSPTVLFDNLENFGVTNRVCIIRACSQDIHLIGIEFSTAYIDGDHSGDAPYWDWVLASPITTKYVLFDNYDDLHPDVKNACTNANDFSEWMTLGVEGITYILERIK